MLGVGDLMHKSEWFSSQYLFLHQGFSSPKPTVDYTFTEEESDSDDSNSLNLATEFPTRHSELEPYVPYHQRPETYIVPIVFAIIFVIGVLGNGTLILIFLRHRTMRNVPNMYICSLAVGDILVILFCVPFTSTVYTVDSWPYGVVVCKFSEFIKDVSIGVSVFTLTALSADRYFAIVDPMRKLAGRRATHMTCFTIAGIWLISILISLPSAIFSYVKTFNETDPIFLVCYPFPENLGPLYPKHFNRHLFCCVTESSHSRRSVKSLCCPNISRVERRGGYRQTYHPASFNSDGCVLGDLNGDDIHRLRRGSTMTSTTSLRTKVTWDSTNRSPTPSQRRSNFLTVDSTNSRKTSIQTQPHPRENEERFHLYPNPSRRLTELSTFSRNAQLQIENEMGITSFIEGISQSNASVQNSK